MLHFNMCVIYVKSVGGTSQMNVNCLLSVFSIDSIVRRDYDRVGSHLESKLETLELVFFQGYSTHGDRSFDYPCISSESESIQVTE